MFVSGSAPLLPATFDEFAARTGHTILERYGMTETGMNTSNPLDGERRCGSVGLPLPGISVRVVDERGIVCGPGEVGSIQVKGPNVFAGYWRMPEKTREEFTADGYFKTGDMGESMPDGYLKIVGRAKDLIITGGLNVYPKEIEERIDALPGVVESAVIAVPDADFGEAVTAIVVAGNGQRAHRGRDHRGAESRYRQLQGAEARALRRRPATQCDGQGREKRTAQALRSPLNACVLRFPTLAPSVAKAAAAQFRAASLRERFPQEKRGHRVQQARERAS